MHLIKGVLNTLKEARHSSPRPVFCPKCKSHRVRLKESYGILPHTYNCQDCGYEGTLVLELEIEE